MDTIKKLFLGRKWWIVFGIIFFAVELYLFAGPFSWIAEDETFYLTGEGAWELSNDQDEGIYIQQIKPQYSYIKTISLLFQNRGFSLQSEGVTITITDLNDTVLFRKDIPYTQLVYGRYTDIETDLHLKAGKKYWLIVECRVDSMGQRAALSMCSSEFYMAENQMLICGEEIPDMQLVTRYIYGNAVDVSEVLILLLMCLIPALGIAFGLPKNNKFRMVTGGILLLLAPIILGQRLELIASYQNTKLLLAIAMKWNIAIMYLLEIVVLLCTQSLRCSIVLTNFILMIVYTANHYVWMYRDTPLRLSDIMAYRTAFRVMDGYQFQPLAQLNLAWCIFIIFLVYGLQAGKDIRQIRFRGKYLVARFAAVVAGVGIAIGSGYLFLYTDFWVKQGFLNCQGFNEFMSYRFDGYLVATCLNIQNSRIQRPKDYSRRMAENILEDAVKSDNDLSDSYDVEELPHVIVILNESFADLRTLGNLQVSEEYLPFFNSLDENTVRGYVNASVLGGGTANSEFEVLTGCSTGLLPQSYYPYLQIMNREEPSLVSAMEDYGYTTYSIHPEMKTNWNRSRVYQYLGFDFSFWLEDFANAETVNGHISDKATYDKIISLYENRGEEEKLFIFDLTMQNHGGYFDINIENPIILNASTNEAEIYLSLIRISDQALEELITYFKNQDEKVIICIFGDHQPKFENQEFYDMLYADTEGQSETERILGQYKTPFVIWANYDIEEQKDEDISINYLGGILLETAGIPRSSYFQFLSGLRQEYPIITINGYVDADGNFSDWSGEDAEFLEYRILQYNYLFDDLAEGF